MGKLYEFLGISVAVVQEGYRQRRKREAFSADITYLTANSLGFTFLQDTSSVERKEDLVRGISFLLLPIYDIYILRFMMKLEVQNV